VIRDANVIPQRLILSNLIRYYDGPNSQKSLKYELLGKAQCRDFSPILLTAGCKPGI
jgi:hypothetical protein